jgi:hypothetical protein
VAKTLEEAIYWLSTANYRTPNGAAPLHDPQPSILCGATIDHSSLIGQALKGFERLKNKFLHDQKIQKHHDNDGDCVCQSYFNG